MDFGEFLAGKEIDVIDVIEGIEGIRISILFFQSCS